MPGRLARARPTLPNRGYSSRDSGGALGPSVCYRPPRIRVQEIAGSAAGRQYQVSRLILVHSEQTRAIFLGARSRCGKPPGSWPLTRNPARGLQLGVVRGFGLRIPGPRPGRISGRSGWPTHRTTWLHAHRADCWRGPSVLTQATWHTNSIRPGDCSGQATPHDEVQS